MTVGERIKKIRLEKGWTQKQLAEKCNIDPANLRKYESGRQNPKIGTLEKIAESLNVNIGSLIEISEKDLQRGWLTAVAEIKLSDKDNEMFNNYLALNEVGRQKVQEYISDLCEIDMYLNNSPAFHQNQKIKKLNPDEEENPR